MAEAKKAPAKKQAPKVEKTTEIKGDFKVTQQKVEGDGWVIKDRKYELIGDRSNPVYKIASRHSEKRPLLWFDPELGYEREIRYATNQRSPFADEQEGHVTLANIIFRNGSIFVPKNKIALQKILSIYHPLSGIRFYEVDTEKEAIDELEILDKEFEAQKLSRELEPEQLEAILRVEYGNKVNQMISLAKDDNVILRNFGIKAVEAGILELSQDQRYFKWKSNGRKLFTVPFDENPYSALAAWFKTDEGVEVYQSIEKRLK